VLTCLASIFTLLFLNSLIFPLLFPTGSPEIFTRKRKRPLVKYHLLSFVITAILISFAYVAIHDPLLNETNFYFGAQLGAFLGLLTGLPFELHCYAIVNGKFEWVPPIWTIISYAVCGSVASLVY